MLPSRTGRKSQDDSASGSPAPPPKKRTIAADLADLAQKEERRRVAKQRLAVAASKIMASPEQGVDLLGEVLVVARRSLQGMKKRSRGNGGEGGDKNESDQRDGQVGAAALLTLAAIFKDITPGVYASMERWTALENVVKVAVW